MLLLSTDPPEPRSHVCTLEPTNLLVEGMRAMRWFVATGFEPPKECGSWLRKHIEERDLQPSSPVETSGAAARYAADAVDRLREEWQSDWSI